MKNNYYVYRHLKPDGEVFYIGMGSGNRAYSKHSRNSFWRGVVKKYGYEVQILKNNLTKEESFYFEILLISWYGRKDLNLGSLVNMTNGGEGNIGYSPSEETKTKHSIRMMGKNNPNFGIKMSITQKEKISKTRTTKNLSLKGNNANAKLVLNLETGIFYDCLKEASESYGINYTTLKSRIRRGNKSSLIYC